MPVQLPPEIYRLIIKYLISSDEAPGHSTAVQEEPIRTLGLPATAIRRSNQASLANLMRVSKEMYDTCQSELYRDCLVGDIDDFAQDIGTNPQKERLLAHVQTLRIYHASKLSVKEPTYTDLIVDDEWLVNGSISTRQDLFLGLRLAEYHPKFAKRFLLCPTAEALRVAAASKFGSQGALCRLESVIMTREGESFPWGIIPQEFRIFNDVLRPPPLPLFLLNLPSVKHYCQSNQTGPLALPNKTLKVVNTPKFVTFHHPGLFVEMGALWLPPIVLGATNRYMCNGTHLIVSSDQPGTALPREDIARFLRPLEAMLRAITVLHVEPDKYTSIPASVSLRNTKIEIYDYIRHCTVSGPGLDLETVERHPTDLSRVQSILNRKIGRWKGRVFLKNREDCPPCTACGFEGFWKYK